ncbi:hypothetical protein [Novosphingobium sp.]|uniref:hypothetical protein n=1 Tax=Novosphingobium sp. TaxID=1874826 RepID=UPI00333EE413
MTGVKMMKVNDENLYSINVKSAIYFSLKKLVFQNPLVYLYARKLFRPDGLVTKTTKLVIEGYPRSANSYVEAAFRLTNGDDADFCHHIHNASIAWDADKKGVPCIVLIREPMKAVISYQNYLGGAANPNALLKEWVIYYKFIKDKCPNAIVVGFDRAINDFNSVVDQLNKKHGSNFPYLDSGQYSSADVFAKVDELSRIRGSVRKTEPYSPFAGKNANDAYKDKLQLSSSEIRQKVDTLLLAQADELYAIFNKSEVV